MPEYSCSNCNCTNEQTPFVSLAFKGEKKHVRLQGLPVLIHKIQTLADIWFGVEVRTPANH